MLPAYILAKFNPYGIRLPKRVKFWESTYRPMYGSTNYSTSGYKKPDDTGWFNGVSADEGRYWSAWSKPTCRACGTQCTTPEARKSHLLTEGCRKKFEQLTKLLNRDKKCIVCNKDTTDKYYGLPICNLQCCHNNFRSWHDQSGVKAARELLDRMGA